MQALLGDEYPAFLASYEEPASAGLRVNTLKLAASDFAALSPYPLKPVDWCPEGFWLSSESEHAGSLSRLRTGQADSLSNKSPGRHPYHTAGLYYLQDPAAMAAVTPNIFPDRRISRPFAVASTPIAAKISVAAIRARETQVQRL